MEPDGTIELEASPTFAEGGPIRVSTIRCAGASAYLLVGQEMVWIRFPAPMIRLVFVWGKPRWPSALGNVELYYVAEFCGVMYY